ncbi:hypothetical protein [Neobacillus sp.]|uniref:hypothetical protein n=1 Tax=Neobacillus sp. TaxID=2675273 RepID=UPI0035B52215
MIKISSLKDFIYIEEKFPIQFTEYLKEEFYSLYEYLSNGEKIEDFLLPLHLYMLVLEEEYELNALLKNKMELEFIDEETLINFTILRIGVKQVEDIQLHYWMVKV